MNYEQMNYEQKYLKYKTKYLQLKNKLSQFYGGEGGQGEKRRNPAQIRKEEERRQAEEAEAKRQAEKQAKREAREAREARETRTSTTAAVATTAAATAPVSTTPIDPNIQAKTNFETEAFTGRQARTNTFSDALRLIDLDDRNIAPKIKIRVENQSMRKVITRFSGVPIRLANDAFEAIRLGSNVGISTNVTYDPSCMVVVTVNGPTAVIDKLYESSSSNSVIAGRRGEYISRKFNNTSNSTSSFMIKILNSDLEDKLRILKDKPSTITREEFALVSFTNKYNPEGTSYFVLNGDVIMAGLNFFTSRGISRENIELQDTRLSRSNPLPDATDGQTMTKKDHQEDIIQQQKDPLRNNELPRK